MDPADFVSSDFGVVRRDLATGVHWFDPAPLPVTLPLDPETSMALSRADASLGRLDGITTPLANPDLIASPYAAREAVASSRIEGTQATVTEVYEADAGKAKARIEDIMTIRSYAKALEIGLASVKDRPLGLDTLQSVHVALMEIPEGVEHAGQWRNQPVWVGSPTGGPQTALFVPPMASRVPELMEEWLGWHARPPRLPLLVRIALLHYQFLTIHPFVDGNGRVGRMLIQMVLEEEKALTAPLLYASAYFAKHRRQYYDRLQAVRQFGEIQQWIQFFLTAVHEQAKDGVARAGALFELRDEFRAELSGVRSRAPEVVDMLFANPVITARHVQAKLEITNQGALNLLRGLEQRGIVGQLSISGRGGTRYWFAPKVMGLFDDETVADEASLK